MARQIFGIDDLLAELIRQDERIISPSNEQVDVLRTLSESVTITETSISTSKGIHPQKWGTFKWGKGAWA
ncbi:hypothetical protein LCGC14_1498460 [marine sediment metagenome]|uniref:Uncharacterized protein n=1 Tax=marine sediment metagenome TaxID=412755 RepID=A0A0F9J4Q7_9ZZZZ